jgi:hypothetical protein
MLASNMKVFILEATCRFPDIWSSAFYVDHDSGLDPICLCDSMNWPPLACCRVAGQALNVPGGNIIRNMVMSDDSEWRAVRRGRVSYAEFVEDIHCS